MNQNSKLPLLPPYLREKYELLGFIASGTYSKVYLAKNIRTNLRVAIKICPNVFYDAIDGKRLLREVLILQQISHPNVIKLIENYLDYNMTPFPNKKDILYIVLEYMPMNLDQFLNSQLSFAQVINIVSQIALGLHYLQLKGIVHRDLRPQNILIDLDGNVKICDFNMACVLRRNRKVLLPFDIQRQNILMQLYTENNFKKETKKQNLENIKPNITQIQVNNQQAIERSVRKCDLTKQMMPRFYRSPEVILLQDYDEKVDIWSFGCILLELTQMLEGKESFGPVFQGDSCYPLSPKRTLEETSEYKYQKQQKVHKLNIEEGCKLSENDQLLKILLLCKDEYNIDTFISIDYFFFFYDNRSRLSEVVPIAIKIKVQKFDQFKGKIPTCPRLSFIINFPVLKIQSDQQIKYELNL